MTENEFDKLFDNFIEEQERLDFPTITDEQATIIGYFISYLENAGLLQIKPQLSPVQNLLKNYPPKVKCKSCGIEYEFQGGVDSLGWVERCKCDV